MSDRLETARLILRPVAERDVDDIVPLANDADVALMTARIPHPYAADDARYWLDHLARHPNGANGVSLAIARPEDDRFIGVVSLDVLPVDRTGILGYWLGKPYWGRGYMTEAAEQALAHGFEELGLDFVRATVLSENSASIKVQEKLGLRLIDMVTEERPARGDSVDVPLRQISRQEWRNAHRT